MKGKQSPTYDRHLQTCCHFHGTHWSWNGRFDTLENLRRDFSPENRWVNCSPDYLWNCSGCSRGKWFRPRHSPFPGTRISSPLPRTERNIKDNIRKHLHTQKRKYLGLVYFCQVFLREFTFALVMPGCRLYTNSVLWHNNRNKKHV